MRVSARYSTYQGYRGRGFARGANCPSGFHSRASRQGRSSPPQYTDNAGYHFLIGVRSLQAPKLIARRQVGRVRWHKARSYDAARWDVCLGDAMPAGNIAEGYLAKEPTLRKLVGYTGRPCVS